MMSGNTIVFIHVLCLSFVYADEMTTSQPKLVLSYEEVNKLKDDPNYILIDVRNSSELQQTGSIPGSINIPLNDLVTTLQLPPSEFKEKYGREEPGKDFNIIFSCRSGRRSSIAQDEALNLGYIHVYNYSGGWLDWEKHTNGEGDEMS